MIRRVGSAVALVVLLSACTGSSGDSDRPRCQMGVGTPSGYSSLDDTFEEQHEDHIGVRVGFEDDEGHELHFLVGIPGEIGEGLPLAGELDLTEGSSGRLLGKDQGWVAVWEQGDRCDPRAVIGNGFTKPEFLQELQDLGLATG